MKPKRITERQLRLLAGFVRDGEIYPRALAVYECERCRRSARSAHLAGLATLEYSRDGSWGLRLTDLGRLALVEAPRC